MHLTDHERITYQMILEAAERGLPCPSNLDIEMKIDCSSTRTPPEVVKALEAKGLISVVRYQRAREVTIHATGKTTARHPDRKTDKLHIPRGTHTA